MKKNGDIKSFSIIRYRGDPTKATTLDGYNVTREEKLFVDEPNWNVFAVCAPYDDHFVYADPAYKLGKPGRNKFMCSCGSMAVLTGYDAYKRDASKQTTAMIVCWHHASFGYHSTGASRWI